MSGNESDVGGIVQETYLSALISINKGTNIENMKSYLMRVLKNKHAFIYRKKYSMPELNELRILSDNSDYLVSGTGFKKTAVTTAIRRELAYLPKIYREALVQYYLEKKSVNEIASNLNISASAVMNRLDRGRDKVKEGVIKMEPFIINSFNPDHLMLFADGRFGMNNEPYSVITNKIEQNILILAYEEPISIKTISVKLGIPTAFAEDAVDKLLVNGFMQSVGSKVYTNFPIIDEDFVISLFDAQNKFIDDSFDKANVIFIGLINEYRKLNLLTGFNEVQLYLYALYSIFMSLYSYLRDSLNLYKRTDYPDRLNDGKWIISYGYKRNDLNKNMINTIHYFWETFYLSNSSEVHMDIFDSNFGISPLSSNKSIRMQDLGELLYTISKGENYHHLNLKLIPDLMELGFLFKDLDDKLKTNIPVISQVDDEKIKRINNDFTMRYVDQLGSLLMEMLENNTIKYPKHISPVSFKIKLISLDGLSQKYALKANEKGVIKIEENKNYPVAYLIEKSL